MEMARDYRLQPGAPSLLSRRAPGKKSDVTNGSLFIVLEGIDGAGTTTQTERLVGHLRGLGRRAMGTGEPSTGPVGRLLREILLGRHHLGLGDGTPMNGSTMALLFAADRLDHLQREVEPLLAAGSDVVSDRYLLSSLAYQAEETDRAWVASLARGVRTPDLTILVDLPVEVAAERRRLAGRPSERYDADGYLSRVAANYRALAHGEPRTAVVDGTRSADEVAADIAALVGRLIGSGT
jgi:dTMP kinase